SGPADQLKRRAQFPALERLSVLRGPGATCRRRLVLKRFPLNFSSSLTKSSRKEMIPGLVAHVQVCRGFLRGCRPFPTIPAIILCGFYHVSGFSRCYGRALTGVYTRRNPRAGKEKRREKGLHGVFRSSNLSLNCAGKGFSGPHRKLAR